MHIPIFFLDSLTPTGTILWLCSSAIDTKIKTDSILKWQCIVSENALEPQITNTWKTYWLENSPHSLENPACILSVSSVYWYFGKYMNRTSMTMAMPKSKPHHQITLKHNKGPNLCQILRCHTNWHHTKEHHRLLIWPCYLSIDIQ